MLSRIVLILSIIVLAIVVVGAFFTWEYGDDYLNMVQMRSDRSWMYPVNLYLHWDGRMLSPAGFILVIFLKLQMAPVAVVFYLLVYAICTWFIWQIILLWWKLEEVSKAALVALFASFMIGTWPLFKDVVYWLTGGYYSIFLLQGLIVLWWYSRQALQPVISNRFSIVKALAIVLLSLNSQNLFLPLAIMMGLHTCYVWWKVNKRSAYALALQYLLPVFLGMLIVSFAPGNWHRIHAETSNPGVHVGFVLGPTVTMLVRFFVYAKWAIVAGLVFGFAFVRLKEKFSVTRILMVLGCCLILALISLAPFLLTIFLARIRVYYFGTLFLMVGCIPAGAFLRQQLESRFKVSAAVGFVPMVCFLVYGIVFFAGQVKLMYSFKKEVATRKNYLESKRGTSEIVHYKRLEAPDNLHLIRWADVKAYGNWEHVDEFFQLGGYVEDSSQ